MPDTTSPSGSAAALTRTIHSRQHDFFLTQIDGLVADLARVVDENAALAVERDALKARVAEIEAKPTEPVTAEAKPEAAK